MGALRTMSFLILKSDEKKKKTKKKKTQNQTNERTNRKTKQTRRTISKKKKQNLARIKVCHKFFSPSFLIIND